MRLHTSKFWHIVGAQLIVVSLPCSYALPGTKTSELVSAGYGHILRQSVIKGPYIHKQAAQKHTKGDENDFSLPLPHQSRVYTLLGKLFSYFALQGHCTILLIAHLGNMAGWVWLGANMPVSSPHTPPLHHGTMVPSTLWS